MTEPRPAYLIPEFLSSDEARPLRILSEYLEPLRRFDAQNIEDTVVFFGSARVESQRRAAQALKREQARSPKRAERLRRCRQAVQWSRYYEEARELARLLTEWSVALDQPRHRFVVCSGGGPGVMEAANRGAHEAGGKTIGLTINLPFEEKPNRYVTDELNFRFHYFFMRKFWFAYLAKALVIFPGGFGTLDEVFEFLTLAQTRRISTKTEVVLYGRSYWDQILNLQPMVDWGAISKRDLKAIHRADEPGEAFEHLKAHLTAHCL
ncbi:MAG TPA: TIGR00730 family Rossman fold protein [Acidobacteria bacterium]|jgi:hypothetical protein|nr:TIGR00730 family Rossman fold protein [Acidobacteriota bacterium]MDP6373028.1 TIGR00730 family Rossman fold protein [Vicinamibacterales bacterium]HAK57068.1 TIGR00730 family Rossman fold protein [Acidobacteriota bacterium]|tara:strand:+ start:898 stop:1692 length:795 start_codon:yes stop_codon:yes gene_type:complete